MHQLRGVRTYAIGDVHGRADLLAQLRWIDFLLHAESFGKIVVHGHTAVAEPDMRPNRINIDTGAYATAKLTCLVLEGEDMTFIWRSSTSRRLHIRSSN